MFLAGQTKQYLLDSANVDWMDQTNILIRLRLIRLFYLETMFWIQAELLIIDFTTMEQVMEYQGKVPPDLLAELIYEYGTLYNAYTIVDITGGMGVATVLKLLEMKYKLLHYDVPRGKILNSKKSFYCIFINKRDKFILVNKIRFPLFERKPKLW